MRIRVKVCSLFFYYSKRSDYDYGCTDGTNPALNECLVTIERASQDLDPYYYSADDVLRFCE